MYWLRAHALGAERDIEVNISNKTFKQKGAKITFHIYNDLCLMVQISQHQGWCATHVYYFYIIVINHRYYIDVQCISLTNDTY